MVFTILCYKTSLLKLKLCRRYTVWTTDIIIACNIVSGNEASRVRNIRCAIPCLDAPTKDSMDTQRLYETHYSSDRQTRSLKQLMSKKVQLALLADYIVANKNDNSSTDNYSILFPSFKSQMFYSRPNKAA